MRFGPVVDFGSPLKERSDAGLDALNLVSVHAAAHRRALGGRARSAELSGWPAFHAPSRTGDGRRKARCIGGVLPGDRTCAPDHRQRRGKISLAYDPRPLRGRGSVGCGNPHGFPWASFFPA